MIIEIQDESSYYKTVANNESFEVLNKKFSGELIIISFLDLLLEGVWLGPHLAKYLAPGLARSPSARSVPSGRSDGGRERSQN